MSTSTTKKISTRAQRKQRTNNKKQTAKAGKWGRQQKPGLRRQKLHTPAPSARRMSFEWDPSDFKLDLQCRRSWSDLPTPPQAEAEHSFTDLPTPQTRILIETDQQEREVEEIEQKKLAMKDRLNKQENDFLEATAAALEESENLLGADEKAKATPPSIRIPRQNSAARKRVSQEVPEDLRSPRTEQQKRLKFGDGLASPDQHKVQSGDRVKIVCAAKKKFLGRCGTVEKYLRKKQKWGIALDGGNRICLGAESLQVLGPSSNLVLQTRMGATNTAMRRVKSSPGPHGEPAGQDVKEHPTMTKARQPSAARVQLGKRVKVKRTKRAKGRWGAVKEHVHKTLEKMPFKMNNCKPATEQQLTEFVEKFPAGCRPKSARQIMLAACVTGRPDIIMALVTSNKCDIHIDNGASQNLLHVAIDSEQPGCALLLLEMGIGFAATDSEGRTALILAAEHGMADVTRGLCQAGADQGVHLNHRNNKKQTSLMIAVIKGHANVVRVLIENEADLRPQDEMQKNALTHAMSYSDAAHKPIVDMIMQKMYQIHQKQNEKPVKLKTKLSEIEAGFEPPSQFELAKRKLARRSVLTSGRKPTRK